MLLLMLSLFISSQDGDDNAVINVPAAHNSLNLLLRDEGLMRFVKYVSAAAPSSRWDIAMEYLPEDDGEDDDDNDDDDNDAGNGLEH